MKILKPFFFSVTFVIGAWTSLLALGNPQDSLQNTLSDDEIITQFFDEHPHLRNAPFDEVVAELQAEIEHLDKQSPRYQQEKSNLDHIYHALTLIATGLVDSVHGIAILGWLGCKLLIWCGRLVWVEGKNAVELWQQYYRKRIEEQEAGL